MIQVSFSNKYLAMDEQSVLDRIDSLKTELSDRVLILGHHYQRDEIIRFADLKGDSYKLAQQAAQQSDKEYIIFCGVHFMAESADIVKKSADQKVILPDLAAGCSLADMASLDQVENAWQQLDSVTDTSNIVPITYINSTAQLKAFCGKRGGIVCTSSNASGAFDWALERGEKLFFFPDQHLGYNTAMTKGFSPEDTLLWDPALPLGGHSAEEIKKARVILWKGWCSIHQTFTKAQVDYFRKSIPGINVLVHPECPKEVVEAADYFGSTGYIIQKIKEARPGSKWVIGTEPNLVNRLKNEFSDKEIHYLSPTVCLCSTMYRIDPPHLLWVLENLKDGRVVNQISVADDVKKWALIALERMLAVA